MVPPASNDKINQTKTQAEMELSTDESERLFFFFITKIALGYARNLIRLFY